MSSYNIDYQIRRYNGTDWDNLFPYTKAANVIYGNSDVDTVLDSLVGHNHDDRYVRYDVNNQGLNATQKTNAKTNLDLNNVENKSAAQLKAAFTGSVSDQSDGFPIGSDVYDAINTAISAVYKPKGSSATIPTLSSVEEGWVYDISAAFTTTADFVEGAGKTYPAGTNIVCIMVSNTKKWDVLTGVTDLSGYVPTSRKVNGHALNSDVSIAAEDINVGGYDTTVKQYLVDLDNSKQANITPERGLSFSGNKLGHSNTAVTAVTTNSFKKIKYDAYGHITGSADVTASDIYGIQDVAQIFVGSSAPSNPKTGDIWLFGSDPA